MSRARRITVVAAVAAVGLSTGAWAAQPDGHPGAPSLPAQALPVTGHVWPFADYLRAAHGDARTAWLQREVDALVRAGAPRALMPVASSGGFAIATTTAAPDFVEAVASLDGHGDDLIETRYPRVNGQQMLQILARRADSGRLLWTRAYPLNPNSFAFPMPILTTNGRPGVGIFGLGVHNDSQKSTMTMSLAGLSGAGKVLWSHLETGTIDSAGNAKDVPDLVATLGHVGWEPDTLLIGRTDYTFDNSGGSSGKVSVRRLSTANGMISSFGPDASSTTGSPQVTGVGDLNGDHYSDVVVTVPGGGVSARSGKSGAQLWSNTDNTLYDGADAEDVGDVHGSAATPADDIAVSTGTPPPGPISGLGLPVPDPTTKAHGQVVLVDGATGNTVWSKTGDGAFAVATAGANHVPATGVFSSDTTTQVSSSGSTTETLTMTTYDDAGNQVYTRSYSASVNGDGQNGDSFGFGAAFAITDYEPDRSLDGVALIVAGSGNNTNAQTIDYSGVDGSAYPKSTATALGAPVDGIGDNWVTVATNKGVRVTVQRGRDRKLLFARSLPSTSTITTAFAVGQRWNRRRCADVVVSGMGKSVNYVGDLASNGQLRWYISFSTTSTKAGTVHPTTSRITATCH